MPDSPTARVGLHPFRRSRGDEIVAGDVITAVNGEAVGSRDDMLALLESRQPGERGAMSVWRVGQSLQQVVTLGGAE